MQRAAERRPRRRSREWAAVALAAALALGAAPASGDDTDAWVLVAPAGMGFRVLMPSEPKQRERRTSILLGRVKTRSFRTASEQGWFSVTVAELPSFARLASRESLMERSRNTFVRTAKVEKRAEADVVRAGRPGTSVDFEARDEVPPRQGRAEFYALDGRMYTFTMSVPKGEPSESAHRFFESIFFEGSEE